MFRRRRAIPATPLRALIFDSHYDLYKGVIAYVRVVEGRVEAAERRPDAGDGGGGQPAGDRLLRPADGADGPRWAPARSAISPPGSRRVRECRVGDTITSAADLQAGPLPGYQHPKPMVFAGFYPVEGEDYANLKDALEKLQLNDASLVFEPETSQALNFGFRCGFLGMFHMEIVQERLEREHDLDLIATAPSVEYEVVLTDGRRWIASTRRPTCPTPTLIVEVREPWMRIQIFTPGELLRHGDGPGHQTARRPSSSRSTRRRAASSCHFDIPLAELIVDFYDQLKSRTRGYASLDYQFSGYRPDDLVKLEILVNEEPVDALAMIVHRDDAYAQGPGAGHQAEGTDPAAAVRRADPGRRRRARDLARQREGRPQGRAGQVLRRRHLAQEEAAREAEEGQEAHEESRRRGDPAGRLHGRAPSRRRVSWRRDALVCDRRSRFHRSQHRSAAASGR